MIAPAAKPQVPRLTEIRYGIMEDRAKLGARTVIEVPGLKNLQEVQEGTRGQGEVARPRTKDRHKGAQSRMRESSGGNPIIGASLVGSLVAPL